MMMMMMTKLQVNTMKRIAGKNEKN